MKIRYRIPGLIFILLIAPVLALFSQYGWRGAGRSGIYNESGLLKSWPASGPALLWESSGNGTGYSSVTVTDNAVYITGRKGNSDVLTSFTHTGKKNWETEYGKASDSNYPDSRATPECIKGYIFVVSGMGDMVCITTDGKIKWSENYFSKYGSPSPKFGISESPLYVDNKIIGTPGGNKAAMVAFNAMTGAVVWETPPIGEPTNYVNPLLVTFGGRKIIVTLTSGHIIGVDAGTGRMLWKFDYEAQNAGQTGRRIHINTPVYRDGYIFAGNGYGQTGVKIRLKEDGSEPVLVWKNTEINPHVGGVVLLGNYLYSSTHDSNSKGRWICVDWTTGETKWTKDWYNKGSVIAADGMLYLFEEKTGHIGLLRPDSQKFDLVSEFQVTKGSGPYWAHPVIDRGRLFVRHGDYLAVYSLK